MENNRNDSSSQKGLVDELVEGRDLTKQLQKMILSNELRSSCNDVYGQVVQNILGKFEKSLQILQFDPDEQSRYQQSNNDYSPFSGSPKSQDSEGDVKNSLAHKNDSKKKRKHVIRVTKRVEGCARSGLEGPIEDQFKWRKYGQKDITGAKFPRAYFRCSNRNEGCLATKLVQRSEDDPSSFNVTYLGNHKCSQASSSFSSPPIIKNPKPNKIEPPLETLVHPFCQQSKENMLIFQNHNNPFSISFPSSSNPKIDDNNVCSNNSSTYCNNINFNDQVFNSSTTLEPNSSFIAPIHPLFDQGDDFDHDFDLNPNFFQ